MSREEKFRMMEIVSDQNNGRVKITPGVGTSNPAESIILAQKAKDLGCDGVVVAPPYFYPLSQENIEQYFETIDMVINTGALVEYRYNRRQDRLYIDIDVDIDGDEVENEVDFHVHMNY